MFYQVLYNNCKWSVRFSWFVYLYSLQRLLCILTGEIKTFIIIIIIIIIIDLKITCIPFRQQQFFFSQNLFWKAQSVSVIFLSEARGRYTYTPLALLPSSLKFVLRLQQAYADWSLIVSQTRWKLITKTDRNVLSYYISKEQTETIYTFYIYIFFFGLGWIFSFFCRS